MMRVFAGVGLGLVFALTGAWWLGALHSPRPEQEFRAYESGSAAIAKGGRSLELPRGASSPEQGIDERQSVEDAASSPSNPELGAVPADVLERDPEAVDEAVDEARNEWTRLFASGPLEELAVEDGYPDAIDFQLRPSKPGQDVATDEWDHRVDSRIYAFFPTDDYDEDAVMVRWLFGSRVLLFDRYPIEQDALQGYVWLRPDNGWRSGRYQVDIYSTDEDMTLLARGGYSLD